MVKRPLKVSFLLCQKPSSNFNIFSKNWVKGLSKLSKNSKRAYHTCTFSTLYPNQSVQLSVCLIFFRLLHFWNSTYGNMINGTGEDHNGNKNNHHQLSLPSLPIIFIATIIINTIFNCYHLHHYHQQLLSVIINHHQPSPIIINHHQSSFTIINNHHYQRTYHYHQASSSRPFA